MMKNETGRSMVEMLGVLAIIGVLSVGGIAGYTMAMNKYKANEILNTASMLAVLAKSSNGGQGVAATGSFDAKNDAGLTIPSGADAISIDANNEVTVTYNSATADGVKSAVCAAASNDPDLYTIKGCTTTGG